MYLRKKHNNTLLDLGHTPTLEELQEHFRKNDFSAATYMELDYDTMDTETVESLEYIKGFFNEKWEPLSQEMGLRSRPIITARIIL